MMKSEDAGAIPILEDDELLGIITDRDIVIRCIAEGEDPAELTADDILSESPEVVEPDTDAEDALEIMGRHKVRRLPVVEDGALVGMVSLGDLAVKRGDLKDTGEALKDVSQGVKPSRRAAAPQPEPQAAGTITRNVTKNPKHSTGITNDLDEEERRQSRVVSIRPDANALQRGQKKSGKREAS
jgi:predicted transcriptional regulator